MKRTLITIALMATCLLGAYAQKNKKNKEEINIDSVMNASMKRFFGDVMVLSGDTQVKTAFEIGKATTHSNKARGLAGKIGNIASKAAMGGALMMGKNIGKGLSMIQKAQSVEQVADLTDAVAGSSAWDYTFAGNTSPVSVPLANQEVNITLRFGENQTLNPKDMYRIVRFSQEKKERIITWMEFDYSLIKSESIKEGGYLEFGAKKIGDDLYQLTIPAEEALPGEYGIFVAQSENVSIPYACTFSIK